MTNIIDNRAKDNESIRKFSDLVDKLADWLYKAESEEIQRSSLSELTYSELHTLKIIGSTNNIKLFEIADKVGVTRPSMSATIDKLEKKGFVFRDKDLNDRRALIVRLTEKGSNANKEHEKFHHNMAEAILGSLTPNQQDVMVEAFESFLNK
ncbi:MAG: MarR family transcriptional regulator [Candidatus Sericytochromatia bacterium]